MSRSSRTSRCREYTQAVRPKEPVANVCWRRGILQEVEETIQEQRLQDGESKQGQARSDNRQDGHFNVDRQTLMSLWLR